MYVAVTRARRRLYLSFAQTRMLHGQTRYNLVSRFLDEIPQGLLKWLTPKFAGTSSRHVADAAHDFADGYVTKARRADSWHQPQSTQWTKRDEGNGWHVGQNVMHDKFGPGVIVSAEGSGSEARVQINFRHAGTKWLALSVAKLLPA